MFQPKITSDVKVYDLSLAQHMMLVTRKYCIFHYIANICTSCVLKRDVDMNLMRQAAELAVQRSDCFQLRLLKQGGKIRQYFAPYEKPEMETWDFTGKTQEEMEAFLSKDTHKDMTQLGKPLYKFSLFKDTHGWCGIYLRVSHIIVDSWGLIVFYKDLMDVFNALENHQELPKPPYSYREKLEKELEYAAGPAHTEDMNWWRENWAQHKPIFTHLAGPGRLDATRKKTRDPQHRYVNVQTLIPRCDRVTELVPADLVTKINDYCSAKSLSPAIFFQMALYSYIARVCKQDSAGMLTMVSGRSKLKERYTGGCVVHGTPIMFDFDWEKSFLDQAVKNQGWQFNCMRHANVGILENLNLQDEVNHSAALETFYCGVFSFQPLPIRSENGEPLHFEWYGTGVANCPFYINVLNDDDTGGWRVITDLIPGHMTAQEYHKVHERLLHFFRSALADDTQALGAIWDSIL